MKSKGFFLLIDIKLEDKKSSEIFLNASIANNNYSFIHVMSRVRYTKQTSHFKMDQLLKILKCDNNIVQNK